MATDDNLKSVINKVKNNIDDSLTVELPKPNIEKPKTNNIGEQIAYYRKLKGMTQKQLCKLLGVYKTTITAYENKEIKLVNVEFLKKAFKVLDIEEKIILPEYETFIMNNQSEKLKKLLEDNNLSSYEFAKIVKVDDSNVQKWLKGKSVMSKSSYNKIKKKFKV